MSRRSLAGLALGGVVVAALVLTGCSTTTSTTSPEKTASAAPAKVTNITVAYAAPTASQAIAWVPRDTGIYKKYGLNATVSLVQTTQQIAQVISGQIDFGFADIGTVTSAELGGAKLINLSPVVAFFQAPIYGAPGIKNAADLKGKIVGDWGPNVNVVTATMNYGLKKLGLSTTDVQHRTFTTTSDMFAALETGQIQAAPVYPPDTLTARNKGMKMLYNVTADHSPYPSLGIYTRADENPTVIKEFLEAYLEGIQVIKHKPDPSIDSIMTELKITDKAVAQESQSFFAKYEPDVPEWTEGLMKQTLQNIASQRPDAATADPKKLYDNSYIAELKSDGFVSALLKKYGSK